MSTNSLSSTATSEGTASNSTGLTSLTGKKRSAHAFDKCPRCLVPFDFIKRATNPSSKVPLILNCKHTVCEDCVYKVCLQGHVVCPVCMEASAIPRNCHSLCELFTPHYSLIGYLVWSKNSSHRMQGALVPAAMTVVGKPVAEDSSDDANDDFSDQDRERSMLPLEFEKCPEHNESYLNIHCKLCNKSVCCYCFLENHPGHQPIYLYKLDEAEMEELIKFKSNASYILRQLYESQKKVKDLKSFDVARVDADIKSVFANLHARLHLAEKSIRENVKNAEVDDDNLSYINAMLKSSIRRIKKILGFFDLVNAKQINVRALLEEVRDLKNIPCNLAAEDGDLDPVQFVVDSSLDNIEDLFAIKRGGSSEYQLEPVQNWDISFENLTEITESALDKSKDQSSSSKAEKRDSTVSSQILTPKPEVSSLSNHSARSSRNSGKDEIKKVVVTHLNDLDSFYIQQVSMQTALNDINRKVSKVHSLEPTSERMLLGKIYAVQYATKKTSKWRRGKLIDIVSDGAKKPQYNVLFIDYGNSQYVTKNKIKELDLSLSRRAPFATECKLINPFGTPWHENAKLHFAQVISEKEVLLKTVRKLNRGVQEVDLMVPNSSGGVIAVTQLLFRCANPEAKSSDVPVVKALPTTTNYKLFANSKSFDIGQSEDVVITHIADPFHISVQLVQNIGAFEKMKTDMESFYHNKNTACIPVEGTDIIVKHETENQGNWHRGRVVLVNSVDRMADVLFVDWGATRTVPWSDVRLLTEEFTRVECQSITIKLAHIERKNKDDLWTQQATAYLQKQVLDGYRFKMVVNCLRPLEVALFKLTSEADICVNALLVQNGFAISTGSISETVHWVRQDHVEEINDNNLSAQLIKKTEEAILAQDDAEFKGGMKQPINIVHYESPGLIYIKFSTNAEKEIELDKELQVYYSGERQTKTKWKVGEECVVWDSRKNKYIRGCVKKIVSSDKYVVYLYDQVKDMTVTNKFMYVYVRYFKKYLNFVYKCHLANIKPAGDSGKWSHLAIEMLQTIFETYKTVYLRKVDGESSKKSMGVTLWYVLTSPGNALEPSRSNYIQINKALVESGAALGTVTRTVPVTDESSSDVEGEVGQTSHEEDTTESETPEEEASGTTELVRDTEPVDWYDMVIQDEEIAKSSQKGWPPPLPLTSYEFDALLRCIDNNAIFSICDMEMYALYEDMENHMKTYFDSANLPNDEYIEWRPGQMCTIKYEGYWYRGTITDCSSKEGEIAVLMIDYDSDHVVGRKQVYRQIMYPDLPPFVSRVQLDDVNPRSGRWDLNEIDTLLKVVTDEVRIVVKGEIKREIPFAEIYLSNGNNLNDLIVHHCPNLIRCKSIGQRRTRTPVMEIAKVSDSVKPARVQSPVKESKEALRSPKRSVTKENDVAPSPTRSLAKENDVTLSSKQNVAEENASSCKAEEEEGDEQSSDAEITVIHSHVSPAPESIELDPDDSSPTELEYTYVPLPDQISDSKVEMLVANVLKYDSVVLDVSSDSAKSKQLALLDAEIQSCAPNQPALTAVVRGQPCICQRSRNGLWSRATVYNTDNLEYGYILAFFVDYGTLDMISTKGLKAMKPEWFDLPVSNYIAHVNVTLLKGKQAEYILNQMSSLCGKSVSVEVVTKKPLSVHLFDGQELCYQNFVDCGILAVS